MKKIIISAAALAASAILTAVPAVAASPGQLQSGSNTFVVKNVTKNGSYAGSVSTVSCGDTIKYSIQLSNTGFGSLNDINVKSTLGSTSNMTAVPAEGAAAGTSASVNVALAANQTLAYNAGSTQLYDTNGALVKTLADGITTGGVNVGSLNGSTNEFVNFTAKVNCPETPGTPETPKTPEAPTTLPDTGAEGGLAALAGTGAMGYAVMQYRRSRQNLKKALRRN